MRRSAFFMLFLLTILAAQGGMAKAQSVESAEGRTFHIDAGGMVSAFQPGEGDQFLVGPGTYVDIHFSHWFQVEAEGRWMRWNQYFAEHQDNYLIGPRVPVWHVGRRGEVYGKALIGIGKMTFPYGGYGTFTDLAFGGSLDFRVSRKVTFRAADFEFQDWPVWLPNQSLQPYGVSMGVAYRVF